MSTLTLPVIIDYLTRTTGCSEELAKGFISVFTDTIEKELADNGKFEVRGIGLFRKTVSASGVGVEYIPDEALARAVNLPFAMFEPVELDEGLTEEMLDAAAKDVEPEMPVESAEPVEETMADNSMEDAPSYVEEDVTSSYIEPVVEREVSSGAVPPPVPEEILQENDTPELTTQVVESKEEESPAVTYERVIEKERVVENPSHRVMTLVLVSVVALLIGFVVGYFASDRLNFRGVKSVSISAEDVQVIHSQPLAVSVDSTYENVGEVASSDTAVTDSAEPSAVAIDIPAAEAVVTDTVRRGRFLTTMALEHYGKKIFWVYIYEENAGKLGNPGQISGGTVVVIPPASKYGIRPGDAASEELAEQKAEEILEKYSKKY